MDIQQLACQILRSAGELSLQAPLLGAGKVAEDPTPYRVVVKSGVGVNRTTKDLFHKKLHSYVITDAIKDENVLKFAVEYVGRYKRKSGTATEVDIEVEGIDTKELMEDDTRLAKIAEIWLAQSMIRAAATSHSKRNAKPRDANAAKPTPTANAASTLVISQSLCLIPSAPPGRESPNAESTLLASHAPRG